jgi:AcrR family transcriptional regulator
MLPKELQEKHEDPRITRTRQLLLEALGALLREKSFEAITVREIAERATLNRVTFYAHFQDKYALLEYAMRSMIRQKMEEQLGDHSSLNEENLKKLILLVCSFLADIEHGCPPPRGQMEPLMEKQIKEEIYHLLQSWLKTASAAANGAVSKPSAEQAAMVSSWAIYGAALQWSQAAQPQAADYFVRQVLPLIQNNLSPYFEKAAVRNAQQKAAAGRAPSALFSSPLLSVCFQI